MKKSLVITLVFAMMILLVPAMGCNSISQGCSHIKSATIGIDRTITLFDYSGKVIKQWKTSGQVEDQGGSFRIMLPGQKVVTISGTVIIEEN